MMSNTDLMIKIEQVTLFLKGAWNIDKLDNKHCQFMVAVIGDNGRKIIFRLYNGKVSVSPVWPYVRGRRNRQSHSYYVSPSRDKSDIGINFSFSRSSKSIAQDIERRFLKKYNETYEECLIEKKEIISNREDLRHVVNAFLRIDHSARVSESLEQPSIYLRSNDSSTTADINLYVNRDYCNMKINYVPVDLAIRIAALLKDNI
jgi:hypothetical protein